MRDDLFPELDRDEDGYGPIVVAAFEGECAGDFDTCSGVIEPGEEIRGRAGSWYHVECVA